MQRQILLRPRCQRDTRHLRAKIRTADTDIHNCAYRFAGVTEPAPFPDRIRKLTHLRQYSMHICCDILTIQHEGFFFRQTQYCMQHGTVFCVINGFASQHCITALLHLLLSCQRQQIQFRRRVHALFGIVEQNATGRCGKMVKALRVRFKQVFQTGHMGSTLLQQAPERRTGNRMSHDSQYNPGRKNRFNTKKRQRPDGSCLNSEISFAGLQPPQRQRAGRFAPSQQH